jgi:AcrR family transcriptional regulator/transcriptional regulator with XRE-family HTH domain
MRSGKLNTRDAVVARTGSAVRAARVAAGLSMRALAERVDVSAATISAIENGTTDVSITRLHQLATALGVAPARLLGQEQPDEQGDGAVAPQPPVTMQAQWRRFPPLRIDPVLSAAIDCFVDTGYHGTTMRTLAARVGVSVPAIYHHYADKQQLLVCSLEVTMNELEWRVAAARAEARTSVEEVALIVEALALFHTHHSKLAFIGASEMRSLEGANRARITKRRNTIQRTLDQAIDRALKDGHLTTRHPRAAGRAIATMCTSLPQWFKPGGPLTADDIARAYTEFALSMLGSGHSRDPHERNES